MGRWGDGEIRRGLILRSPHRRRRSNAETLDYAERWMCLKTCVRNGSSKGLRPRLNHLIQSKSVQLGFDSPSEHCR
jgi:hypothetical protein